MCFLFGSFGVRGSLGFYVWFFDSNLVWDFWWFELYFCSVLGELSYLFFIFVSLVDNEKKVWYTAVWVIWKLRNDCIFSNEVAEVLSPIVKIAILSW